MRNEKRTAIILAAGQGRRMNSVVQKQYLLMQGYPVLYYSIKVFEESNVDDIVLVTGSEEIEYCQKEIVERYGFKKIRRIVAGGKERYHSVYAGLQAVEHADYVLIHDGARPFVTKEMIEQTLEGAKVHGACVVGMPVKDTIKIINEGGFVEVTPDRSKVWMMQTPQTFSYSLIFDAYKKIMGLDNVSVTDDAMVLEVITGKKTKVVEGSYENIKITTPSDLQIAECFIR